MALIITDFARLIFSNVAGPTLPRRQRVRIEGFTGYDNGDEIVLSVNPRIIPFTLGLSERPGINDGEYVRTLGHTTTNDGGGAEFVYRSGVTSGADGSVVINTVDGLGQYQMVLDYGRPVNIRQLGCLPNGTTACGAKINAFLAFWLATYGFNAQLTLDVPGFPRTTTGGYRLETGIKVPGQMAITIRGNGKPYIDGLLWTASTAGCYRSGSVFVADANVTAIEKLNHSDGTVPTLQLDNVGFLGPGGDFTTGHGIDCQTGLVASTNVAHFAGFNIGYYMRAVVSVHSVNLLKCTGCIEGLRIGTPGLEQAFYDGEFNGYDGEFNENGLVIDCARDLVFNGGLIQSNYNGIVLGNASGTHSMRCIHLTINHYENNGDGAATGGGTVLPPWGTLGGRPLVLYTGGAIDAVTFANTTCGGEAYTGTTPFDVTVPAAASICFDHTYMSGRLTMPAGSYAELRSADRLSGFTAFTIANNCTINWTCQAIAGGGQLTGSYTHDYASGGSLVRRQLTGNVTLPNVTNMPNGHVITFFFIQDATASRTVTFGAPFKMDAWDTTGFNVAGSRSSISFMMSDGDLLQVQPQPSGGWLL